MSAAVGTLARPSPAVSAPRAALRWYERSAVLASALGALVLCVLCIEIVAAAHPSYLVPPAKGGFGGWMVGPFKGVATGLTRDHITLGLIFSGLMVSMTAAYLVIVAGSRRLSLRWVVAAIAVAHLVLMLGPPLLLTDVFNYLDYARLGVLHDLNPFTAVPADAGGDPTFHYATWHHLSSPYGPLFTLFTYALVPLDVHPGYWTLKALTTLASLGSLALVWRIALRLGRPALPAVAFVGLNPLLLVFGLGGVHNDFFIMLAVLVGLSALLAERPALGGALLVAAAGMKATAGVLLPFAIVGQSERRRVLAGMLAAALALGVVSLLAFGPTPPSLGPQTSLVSPLAALNLLGLGLGLGGATRGLQIVSQVALLGVLAVLLRRTWRGESWIEMAGWAILALLLSLSWVVPWYVMWLLPIAAIAGRLALRRAALVMTVVLLLTSLPATAELLSRIDWYPDHTPLGRQHVKEIRKYLK